MVAAWLTRCPGDAERGRLVQQPSPSASEYVLLADIGGTNARFALADPCAPMPLLDDSIRSYAVDAYASLADAARHYLDTTGARPSRAILAVAGRVEGGNARMTNHSWVVSRERLQQALAERAASRRGWVQPIMPASPRPATR